MSQSLTLFAMTKKGFAVLSALMQEAPGIVKTVVTARDTAVADDYCDAILALCRDHGVPTMERTESFQLNSDYAMAVSWRWKIDLPARRLIVLHDSLLPRYRGFNPLPTALIRGDEEIGVTALFATDEYDCGDVIAQASQAISYPIRIDQAIDSMLELYRDLVLQIAAMLAEGIEMPASPQDDSQATYSLWRDEEDYAIDWSQSATDLRRFVDAVGHPYKGASTTLHGQRLRIRQVRALPDVSIANRTPGKVIFMRSGRPVVVCGEGLLLLEKVEDEHGEVIDRFDRFRLRFQ
ncbi:MAG: hypothetical protein KDA42_04105 [Planctomycetales bacterium]|nr:hypothetical protein [Planctomycetales bacterium]